MIRHRASSRPAPVGTAPAIRCGRRFALPFGFVLTIAVASGAIGVAMVAEPAHAQFGDTNLSYKDGIVYDDDLVPGRGPNQGFDVDLLTSPPAVGSPLAGGTDLADPSLQARERARVFESIQSDALQRTVPRNR